MNVYMCGVIVLYCIVLCCVVCDCMLLWLAAAHFDEDEKPTYVQYLGKRVLW